jgi:hypothetical protein
LEGEGNLILLLSQKGGSIMTTPKATILYSSKTGKAIR